MKHIPCLCCHENVTAAGHLYCAPAICSLVSGGCSSLVLRPCQGVDSTSNLGLTPGFITSVLPGVLPCVESDVSTWQGEGTSPSRPRERAYPATSDQVMPACVSNIDGSAVTGNSKSLSQ